MVLRLSIKERSVPLVPIGVGLAAFVLAGALLVHLWQRSFGVGWFIVEAVCCVAGAMVVTWLGWCVHRLLESVTSIARQLKQDGEAGKLDGTDAAEELADAIAQRIDLYRQKQLSLEEQIKQLQIQLQLAQRQKQNTDAIIYSIRDAVIVVDEFNRLLMANEAAGNLFGFDYKDSQYSPISKLVKPDKEEFTTFLSKSRINKSRASRRELAFADGDRIRTFDCIISCVYDKREQVCGTVAVLHDITREKEISQMKNDFVSHVSHELKTPLASITAYAEMLADGEATDEKTQKEFYSIIQSQANRLSRLIEDILNTARIESGLIKVDKKPVSLTILIEEQLGMIKGYAEEKDIEIVTQKPIIFDQVYVDHDMMAQVIVNLLSNAVKYTPNGGRVSIETEVDEIAKVVRAKISDTGVGIPEDEIEHVFDKFYRVKANDKQAKGTGLGLNLVKQIVEKVHEGRVFVISKAGQGSTFGFELPLAVNEPAAVTG
jgi:two-component system phosphate regulon sensor histidine kinase PhoR